MVLFYFLFYTEVQFLNNSTAELLEMSLISKSPTSIYGKPAQSSSSSSNGKKSQDGIKIRAESEAIFQEVILMKN